MPKNTISPHDPIKMLRKCCPRCYSRNIVEPFEMDGIEDGEYQRHGLWWVVCRDCGRTSRYHNV